jgi:hypothetical protein
MCSQQSAFAIRSSKACREAGSAGMTNTVIFEPLAQYLGTRHLKLWSRQLNSSGSTHILLPRDLVGLVMLRGFPPALVGLGVMVCNRPAVWQLLARIE